MEDADGQRPTSAVDDVDDARTMSDGNVAPPAALARLSDYAATRGKRILLPGTEEYDSIRDRSAFVFRNPLNYAPL